MKQDKLDRPNVQKNTESLQSHGSLLSIYLLSTGRTNCTHYFYQRINLVTFLPRDASAERGDATVSRPSVRLSVRDVQVSATHRLEFSENNFTAE